MEEPQETLTIEAFQAHFIRYQDALKSYLFRITAHRQDAEDLAQETYLKAARQLSSFSGKSTLKTWVFAIATNLAYDHFRARRRWKDDMQKRCRASIEASPEHLGEMQTLARQVAEAYDFKEHIDFCFTCLAKTLDIEQQLVLILKEVYQFKVREIMEIMRCSEGKVKHALARGRQVMTDIFDRRCALISKQGTCHECSELQGFINPKQDARAKALQLKMVQEAEKGNSKTHLFELRAELVRNIDPLNVPGTALHAFLFERMPD